MDLMMQMSFAGVLASESLIDHVAPVTLFSFPVGGYTVDFTNHMFMVAVAAILMLLIFPVLGGQSKRSPVPTGIRNFFEAIMSYLRTEVFRPALGDHTDRFVGFLWTVFFFILFCNLAGMIPIAAIIAIINGKAGTHIPHYGGTATANITVTAGLAILMFLTIHLSGIAQQIRIQMDPTLDPHHGHDLGEGRGGGAAQAAAEHEETHKLAGNSFATTHHAHVAGGVDVHGHGAVAGRPFVLAVPFGAAMYVKNFVPAVPLYLWPLMFILELIGAAVKPFALAVRLFANMMAGHLILAALIALVPVASVLTMATIAQTTSIAIPVILGASALQLLELFVAFLQAYIFTFLSTLFIAAAIAPEH